MILLLLLFEDAFKIMLHKIATSRKRAISFHAFLRVVHWIGKDGKRKWIKRLLKNKLKHLYGSESNYHDFNEIISRNFSTSSLFFSLNSIMKNKMSLPR
jgi:hypothetical protein